MLNAQRRKEMMRRLRSDGSVQVADLVTGLGISASTARRDLSELEEQGRVVRVHGGAVLVDEAAGGEPGLEPERGVRTSEHSDVKARLGAAAAGLVGARETVLITGGTTTEAMLPHLVGRENLTVVTNALNVTQYFVQHPGVNVVMLGGYLRHAEMTLLGHLVGLCLRELSVDRMFLSAFGVDQAGIAGANVSETETDRQLISHVPELVVLADASKFTRRGPVRLARPAQIAALVTDEDAPAETLRAFRDAGTRVTRV